MFEWWCRLTARKIRDQLMPSIRDHLMPPDTIRFPLQLSLFGRDYYEGYWHRRPVEDDTQAVVLPVHLWDTIKPGTVLQVDDELLLVDRVLTGFMDHGYAYVTRGYRGTPIQDHYYHHRPMIYVVESANELQRNPGGSD